MNDYFMLTGTTGYEYLTGTKWTTSSATATTDSNQEGSWMNYDAWKSAEFFYREREVVWRQHYRAGNVLPYIYGTDPFNINTNEKQFKLLKII